MKLNFFALDALRGLAALIVLLFHYWDFYEDNSYYIFSFLSIGHIGVDLFFVLSGFLITLSLWNSKDFFVYIKKRFLRIIPLAFLTTCIFWILKTDLSVLSFQDLFAHLFFINGFFPQWYSSINPVSWSISIEMMFYLLLPFLWYRLSKRKIDNFIIISFSLVIISFSYRAGLFFIFDDWSIKEKLIFSEQLWGRFDQFFLGIFLAYLLSYKKDILEKYSKYTFVLSILFLLISSVLFFVLESSFRDCLLLQVFLHFITGLGFFFLIWKFIFLSKSYKDNFLIKTFSFLGTISYGLYLLHFPIISIVYRFIDNSFLALFIILFITIISSYISWNYFEKYFLKKK
jgi:peptidoglycan/LPS O-acetylase OafA/YrhL